LHGATAGSLNCRPELQGKDEALKIDQNKHAAAAYAVEQMADLASVFRGAKHKTKFVTAKGDCCEMLANKLEEHFRNTNILNIEGGKLKAGVDFLACFPSMLSKACATVTMVSYLRVLQMPTTLFCCFLQLAHHQNAVKGFFAAGMLDEKSEA
jgi:hypothetical protein